MSTNINILVFGAHPDDAEVGMGGTIAKHVLAGMNVGICDLTLAELSSNGTVELRKQEAEESRKVLGVSYRSNLGLPDRGLELNPSHISKITSEIRRFKPKIVFVPYWKDRHPDHVKCGRLVEEAVFNAKLHRYMPEIASFTVDQVYYYFINDLGRADLVVDVSDVYERKVKALACYRSQFELADKGDSIVTPLNTDFIHRIKCRDTLFGKECSVSYAEGFVTAKPFAINLFS